MYLQSYTHCKKLSFFFLLHLAFLEINFNVRSQESLLSLFEFSLNSKQYDWFFTISKKIGFFFFAIWFLFGFRSLRYSYAILL